MVEPCLQIFHRIQARSAPGFLRRSGLVCKVGNYLNSAVIKLQKPAWTNDSMSSVRNTSGLFFALWVEPESLRLHRALYNIHAIKLPELKKYPISNPKPFAKAFRIQLAKTRDLWPNLRLDFTTPRTLMEGWITLHPESFAADALDLLKRFEPVSRLLDSLLLEHRTK